MKSRFLLLASTYNRICGPLISLAALFFLAWGAAKFLILDAPLEHADAIVVLSGSAVIKELVQFAAQLYKAGRAPIVILTNDNQKGSWSSAEQRNPFFYEGAVDLLISGGVPRAVIEILMEPVSGTCDEARLLGRYAEDHGLKSILVVTSAYHSRRALWTLRQAFAINGITVGLSVVPPGNQSPSPIAWWLYIRGWQMVAGEYPKLVYYWLRCLPVVAPVER